MLNSARFAEQFSHVGRSIRPPANLTITEWCEENVVLSSIDSSEPGPYRVSRTPYARAIMEAYASPHVRKITLLCATQVGKTQIAKNLLAWTVCNKPGPMLYVLPDRDVARKFSEDRILTMFDSCEALKAHLTERPRDKQKLRYKLDNSLLLFAWAGSPSSLASMPICYVFLDEVGKFPMSVRKEADPVSLARQRTMTFPGRSKIICTSTPTVPDDLIMQEWDRSVQHKYHVPCPHCGIFQTLEWSQIKFPEGERDPERVLSGNLAWYECSHCGERITDRDKPAMLAKGEWFREGEQEAGDASHVGFHMSAIYSPWVSFSLVVHEFLASQGNREKLQNFTNSWLAEPFQEKVSGLETAKLSPLLTEATLERGTLPEETQILTGFIDWHGERKGLYWNLWAWGYGYRGWLIDYGQEFSIADIDQQLVRIFEQGGRRFAPTIGVDSGWGERVSEVYQFCHSRQPYCIPTKGQQSMTLAVKPFTIDAARHKLARGFKGLHVDTMHYKDIFARLLDPVEREREENQDRNRIELCKSADQALLKQWAAEHKIVKKGKEVWEPKYQGADNHWFDCAVGALAMAEFKGLWKLQPLERDTQASEAKRQAKEAALRGSGMQDNPAAAYAARRGR